MVYHKITQINLSGGEANDAAQGDGFWQDALFG